MTELCVKWSCEYCTYENWPSAVKCTMCRAQRPSATIITEEPFLSGAGHQWDPVGNDSLLICPDSSARPRVRPAESSEHSGKWSCQNCPKSSRCVVCDHPRPNDAFQPREPDEPSSLINERDRGRARGVCSGAQRHSSASSKREAELQIELAAGAQSGKEEIEVDFKKLKQIKNRMRRTDWLFLNACAGVVEGDLSAVEAYKSSGGDIARQLTSDEVRLLNRPSAFDSGFTLELTCVCFLVCLTDIEDLPAAVQEKLFDEILDRDVQKELEEESAVINWSLELGTRLDSRLYALWNRTAGDCLLDSVLQATWGIYDKDSVLRKALHDSLHDCSHWFYSRWKEWESWYSQSFGLHFSLREEQWQEDWAFILSLARWLICVFLCVCVCVCVCAGVYLPLLWEQSFCWKSPIALGYTRGHFSALVGMETDGYDNRGAGANLNTDDDITVTFLPLVDSERKLLQIHFLSAQEMGSEEQQERLLRDWLDCCVTDGGMLAAMQKSSRRRHHPLITQMLEKWLDGYRQMHPCPTLSDEEDEEDDEDE
uniref:ubiquitinyl hydrolase 1 n=1 Tax=Cyprinus carpio TaxID=7962 RepID=A0A8C2H9G4_CYPCA